MKIILASASPRRKDLFKLIASDFVVIPADIDETIPQGVKPSEAAEYLAVKKTLAVASKVNDVNNKNSSNNYANEDYINKNEDCINNNHICTDDICIVGCDTIVIQNDEIYGKPKDESDAKRILGNLSGKKHFVITGCCIYLNGKSRSFSEMTEVEFYSLSENEIDEYIKTREPFDKAGAYGIQEKGALLVKSINGDYFNVVGLPIARLKRKIQEFTKC